MRAQHNIVVFDGICNLCGSIIDFIAARDSGDLFAFVPMQSRRGQELLREHGISVDRVDTFLLIRDVDALAKGDALVRSDAAIAIVADLGRPWSALAALRLVPRPVRDWAYSLVARNRYRLFGKRATCKFAD